jgi:hypothetical protein
LAKEAPTIYVETDAFLSPCGTYRYWLNRWWDRSKPLAILVMLNPSSADVTEDDPTIHCCVRLAKREGFGGIHVVNLFAYRTPDRKYLATVLDPIGPDNDQHILEAVALGAVTVLAWGGFVAVPERPNRVLEILRGTTKPLKCIEMIGPLGNRQPRHPLYLRKNAVLIDFDEA